MKKILLITIGLLFSSMTVADSNKDTSQKINYQSSNFNFCKNTAIGSKSYIRRSQYGISKEDTLMFADSIVEEIKEEEKRKNQFDKKQAEKLKKFSDVNSSIVLMAYRKPIKRSKEEKEKAIKDFVNKVFLDCYKQK